VSEWNPEHLVDERLAEAIHGREVADVDLTHDRRYLLAPDGRVQFLDAYGEVSPEQPLSARVLAWFMCATLAVYAAEEGARTCSRKR
jgi:hypothetical protein